MMAMEADEPAQTDAAEDRVEAATIAGADGDTPQPDDPASTANAPEAESTGEQADQGAGADARDGTAGDRQAVAQETGQDAPPAAPARRGRGKASSAARTGASGSDDAALPERRGGRTAKIGGTDQAPAAESAASDGDDAGARPKRRGGQVAKTGSTGEAAAAESAASDNDNDNATGEASPAQPAVAKRRGRKPAAASAAKARAETDDSAAAASAAVASEAPSEASGEPSDAGTGAEPKRKGGRKAAARAAPADSGSAAQGGRASPGSAATTGRKRRGPSASETPAKAAAARAGGRGGRRQHVEETPETSAPPAPRARKSAQADEAPTAEQGKARTKPAAQGRDLAQAGRKPENAVATQEPRKRWSPFAGYAKAGEKLLVRMRAEKLASPEDVIESIRKGPQGSQIIAAFDFDGTLVGGFTGAMLMQERFRRKEVKFAEIAETAGVTFKAMAKLLEGSEVVAHSMAQWAGKTEDEMEELSSHLYENKIQDAVFPEMRKILDAHREAGHTIVVATSASRYQVAPTVKALGIDHLLCTDLEVAEGKLTGKLIGDSLFGPGKVAAIERFVAERGGHLADVHFYADGDEECALMTAVGFPHPVNPSRKLSDAARANGWPVLRFQSRGSVKPLNFVRGIAGLISILPILQAGFAVGLMTRDKRQAANLIMPTWIQAQLDLAGVKLRVTGRKNLFARRPAVFIFNHRNNYDGSFVAALVRTDYVSLAKKEMVNNPVGKLAAAIIPTVLIDREAGGDPRQLLQPVVEAVDKGYSIMLAPEGTRVAGRQGSVGPFKKGAFHMAMAAGIPIVPVVIRNALDVAARDAGAMRPGTVDIAVLPPIPIEDWTAENLDEKVADVRELFIETLNNWPEPDEIEIEG